MEEDIRIKTVLFRRLLIREVRSKELHHVLALSNQRVLRRGKGLSLNICIILVAIGRRGEG